MLCNIRVQLNLLALLLALMHSGSALPPFIIRQHDEHEILYKVASRGNHPKSFSLLCEAGGDPPPRYRWTKNGEHFNVSEYEDRIVMTAPNGTLTFRVPADDDEAVYQCFAKNKHGFATFRAHTVRKSYLEGFKDGSIHVVDAIAGRPLKLECRAPNGYPPPTVYWMIQTRGSGEIQSIDDSRKTVDPEGNLWFAAVSEADVLGTGEFYACAASSAFRNEYKLGKRVQLRLIHANESETEAAAESDPIMQFVTPPHVVALRGQRTEFFCIYSGDALAQVTWRLNGSAIGFDKRILEKNYGKSLLIRDTRLLDRGLYSCEGSANQSSLIALDVLAAPYFISHPKPVVAVENETTTAEFMCEVRGVPEPTIVWTHNGRVLNVTHEDASTTTAVAGERLSVLKNKLTIRDLIKSDIGNYGCNASNTLGYSYRDFYLDMVKPQTPSN